MDIEILFTALQNDNWKSFIESGKYEPEELDSTGAITCADGKNLNSYLNGSFPEDDKIMVLVLDPLRIQSPMKRHKSGTEERIMVKEAISLDAVIDKITVGKGDDGKFNMSVRHFE